MVSWWLAASWAVARALISRCCSRIRASRIVACAISRSRRALASVSRRWAMTISARSRKAAASASEKPGAGLRIDQAEGADPQPGPQARAACPRRSGSRSGGDHGQVAEARVASGRRARPAGRRCGWCDGRSSFSRGIAAGTSMQGVFGHCSVSSMKADEGAAHAEQAAGGAADRVEMRLGRRPEDAQGVEGGEPLRLTIRLSRHDPSPGAACAERCSPPRRGSDGAAGPGFQASPTCGGGARSRAASSAQTMPSIM